MREPLGPQRSHVHEGDGALVAAQLVTHGEIAREGPLDHVIVNLHVGEHRAEGGAAAVVAPVRIDHLDLGDRGVALLIVFEVPLAECDVGQIHGQPAIGDEGRETLLIELSETRDDLDRIRFGIIHLKRIDRHQRCLARLDRVDDVALYRGDVLLCQGAFEHVHLRIAHHGPLALADELDALARRGRTLVELPGVLQRTARDVGLRLAEHGGNAIFE